MLAFVFFLTPVSGLVFAGTEEVEAAPRRESPAPVVMVVFDELPGHALMDANGRLDAKRFPSFAALGEDATWYRERDHLAQRHRARGAHPRDRNPRATRQPRRPPPTIRARSSRCSRPATRCTSRSRGRTSAPSELCDGSTESIDEGGLGSILATIPPILGYVSVPDAKRLGIPSPRESGALSRPGQVETFIEEIEPADGPVLHFLHVLLPHKAWRYLPSGERYSDTVGATPSSAGSSAGTTTSGRCSSTSSASCSSSATRTGCSATCFDELREDGLYDDR